MAWGRKKTYGSYRVETCPFCGDRAYSKNKQGMAVCAQHKNAEMGDQKCVCGEYLDVREGKWGAFFLCKNCGPLSMNKVLGANKVEDQKTVKHDRYVEKRRVGGRTETVVRSDDPNYFS